MGIEYDGPTTTGKIIISAEPGLFLLGTPGKDEVTAHFVGSQGARALTRLIDAATTLRAGLRDAG